MLLHELRSPPEVKFGGSLTDEELARCERQTELNSPRWKPYPWRAPFVENICGKFVVCTREAGHGATGSPCHDLDESGIPDPVAFMGGACAAYDSEGSPYDIDDFHSMLASVGGEAASPSCPPISSCHWDGSVSPTTSEAKHRNGENTVTNQTTPSTTPKPFGSAAYTSCLDRVQTILDPRLRSVCFDKMTPFGIQQEIMHLDGHITARCSPGLAKSLIFKGARGMESVSRIMKDLFLDEGKTAPIIPLVHMGVVSSCMGVRVQTTERCYLENKVVNCMGMMRGGWMSVESRVPDQCNIIRLSVNDWNDLLPARLIPVSNDIVITGKGSILHRLAWTGLAWNERVEAEILSACESVVAAIVSVC